MGNIKSEKPKPEIGDWVKDTYATGIEGLVIGIGAYTVDVDTGSKVVQLHGSRANVQQNEKQDARITKQQEFDSGVDPK